MDKPVSIIIPIYNAKAFLNQCVESLLQQSYTDIEILLIDDGSTDGSAELCDSLAAKNPQVVVHHKENGGANTARSLGVRLAKGEYVMFLDADDWLDTDAVEQILSVAREHSPDVIRFNYVQEFGDYSTTKKNHILHSGFRNADECKKILRQSVGLIGDELLHPENQNILASCCCNAYKKALLLENNISFYDIREYAAFVDGMFNIDVYKNMSSFYYMDAALYHYRKGNSNSASSKYRANYLVRQKKCFESIESRLKGLAESDFAEAIYSRIGLSIMEMCLNSLSSPDSFYTKYKEMRCVLHDEVCHNAICSLNISHMTVVWKLYYTCVRCRFTLGTYFLTYMIRKIKSKGK